MAMINCPNCGQDVSEKAKKCIHCGVELIKETQKELKCVECGAILEEKAESCPQCGCPVEKDALDKPQQVEVASIKMADKTKKSIIGIVIAVVVLIMCGVGYKVYSDNKEKQEYEESYNTYVDNIKKIQVLMYSGASEAESLCNLTIRVWANAIYEDKDDTTDKYTRPRGYFVSDFNEALANLYADSSTQSKIESIEKNQASVRDWMKQIQNPPVGLEKCYDTLSSLYEDYKVLTDLAINPSGSLSTVSDKKNEVITDFIATFETLDTQIPEKIANE